jgi:hypothetical protein
VQKILILITEGDHRNEKDSNRYKYHHRGGSVCPLSSTVGLETIKEITLLQLRTVIIMIFFYNQ